VTEPAPSRCLRRRARFPFGPRESTASGRQTYTVFDFSGKPRTNRDFRSSHFPCVSIEFIAVPILVNASTTW